MLIMLSSYRVYEKIMAVQVLIFTQWLELPNIAHFALAISKFLG